MYDDETEGCLLFIFIILFIVINIFMWKSDTNASIMNITKDVNIERTEYKSSSTTLIPSNINGMLVMKTITNPEKYNIEVKYNGKNYILDNKDKYYYIINNDIDKIKAQFKIVLDKNKEIKSINLINILIGSDNND